MILTCRFAAPTGGRTGRAFLRTVLKRLHGCPTGPSALRGPARFGTRPHLRDDAGFIELMLPNPRAREPYPRLERTAVDERLPGLGAAWSTPPEPARSRSGVHAPAS